MNTPTPGLVSVIMLVRDRLDHTRQALNSLTEVDYTATEFVIVDNGSSSDTAEFLCDWHAGSPRAVQVLRFADDPGGSERRNIGASAARGQYLFFVDNDVIADDPTLVTALVSALAADQTLGAVSPLLLFPGEQPLVQCAGGGSTAQGRIGLLGRGEVPSPSHHTSREQTWAPTAALMVRRSSFERVGGFDTALDPVALCEDVDLCCRIRAAGERIGYIGHASLRHYEGTTFNHLGFDKLPVWHRHMRVMRARWSDVFARGPIHTNEDLAWRALRKDYRDLTRPVVRQASPHEPPDQDTSFFASTGTPALPDVRVGVLGCGQAAVRGALPAYTAPTCEAPDPAPFLNFGRVDGVRVAGIADPEVSSLLAAARWYSVPHALLDAATLLDTVPVEGVVVCTPPHSHAALVFSALRRGVSVLVEKPAAITRQELADLLAAVADHPEQTVMVNLPWQYHVVVRCARDLLTTGAIGEILGWNIVFEHNGPEAWAPRATWYRTAPGGVITDLGPHTLAVAKYLLGGDVGAPVDTVLLNTDGTTPVRARATIAVGECLGTLEIGWDAPGPRFTVTVSGTGGELQFDLVPFHPAIPAVRVRTDRADRTIEFEPDASGPVGPYAEFIAALRSEPTVPGTRLTEVADIVGAVIEWSRMPAKSVDSVGNQR
ncbi:Gfo/Idh/MocA family oxidoreductase [Nocardia sp. NBC_01388]|uniref:Gfo/Idh/MocA family oxidoreductase n=1 Tax=Nocardia sp. NBC_01388 TaxID=2903596 RepID=UPI003245816B